MTTLTLESLTKNPRLTKWLPLALLLLTILIFKNVMACHLVNLDDPTYVSDSPIHQGLTPFVLKWAFTNHFWAGFYIPITWLSYALDVTLMGNKAEAFHLTNLILHAANTLLLYALLNRFTPDKWRSFLVAALWALHPLRVESVAWVTERKDVLFLFFGLCSLLSFIHYAHNGARHRKWFYFLSLASFALSLLAKPTLITFPFLLLLMDWWPLRRFQPKSVNLWLFLEKIPFLVFAMTIGIVTLLAQKRSGALSVVDANMRIETALCGYGQYLLHTIYPLNLAGLIAFQLHWPAYQVILSTLTLIIITAICVWLWWRNQECRAPLFGWLWFLLTLLPTSGLLQSGPQASADRFTYFPSIGLILAIVFAIPFSWSHFPTVSKILIATALALISAEGIITINQVDVWHDSGTFWRRTLSVSPDNITARLDYSAYLLAEANDLEGAIAQCKWMVERYPIDPVAWNNWGVALERQSHFTDALEKYSQARSLAPSQPLYQEAVQRMLLKLQANTVPTTRS